MKCRGTPASHPFVLSMLLSSLQSPLSLPLPLFPFSLPPLSLSESPLSLLLSTVAFQIERMIVREREKENRRHILLSISYIFLVFVHNNFKKSYQKLP